MNAYELRKNTNVSKKIIVGKITSSLIICSAYFYYPPVAFSSMLLYRHNTNVLCVFSKRMYNIFTQHKHTTHIHDSHNMRLLCFNIVKTHAKWSIKCKAKMKLVKVFLLMCGVWRTLMWGLQYNCVCVLLLWFWSLVHTHTHTHAQYVNFLVFSQIILFYNFPIKKCFCCK